MEKSIPPFKIDLAKSGLESCFKPYKVLMLKYAWDKLTKDMPMGSGDIWRKVNELLPEGETMSRASIIFSADDFVDIYGIWGWKDRTSKGGHSRLYYPLISEAGFWELLAESLKNSVNSNAGTKLL